MKVIMNDNAFLKKGFKISTDQSLFDFATIFKFLSQESYWAKGITPEKVKSAIANSLCFGVFHLDQQIGLARVITDKATFAYLCDVFVLDEYRGQGLSKWLLQTVVAHPDLQGLRRWSLATRDAHGLYQQFGFVLISRPETWMEIFKPYTSI